MLLNVCLFVYQKDDMRTLVKRKTKKTEKEREIDSEIKKKVRKIER
jgi:hypothetical protein